MSETDLVIATWALVVATILIALITFFATPRGWKEARRLAEEDRDAAETRAAQAQRQSYANWQRSETLKNLAQLVVAGEVVDDAVGRVLGAAGLLKRGTYDRTRFAEALERIPGIEDAKRDISNAAAILDLVATPEIKDVVHSVEERCKDLTRSFVLYRSEAILAAKTDPLPELDQLVEARKAFGEATTLLSHESLMRNLETAGSVYKT